MNKLARLSGSFPRAPSLLRASILASILLASIRPLVSARGDDGYVGSGSRWSELRLPKTNREGFTQMEAAVTGIAFTNLLAPDRYLTNTMLLNGSGVTVGDVDGDGR